MFSEALLGRLIEISRDYDVVGLSVFTHNFKLAAAVTERLKKAGQPLVVWGGIHPTIDPDSSLEFADGVCLGEAEEAFTEFLTRLMTEGGEEPWATPGFWFQRRTGIVRNPLREPPADLDSLPLPDITHQGHYLQEGEDIVPLDRDSLAAAFSQHRLSDNKGVLYPAYLTVFSRGCPHSCTFCCNNRLNQLFGRRHMAVRSRGLEKIFDEVRLAKAIIPGLGFVTIQDDNFLAQPVEIIKEFACRWPGEIGLPFKISGSVAFISRERIEALVEAGLMHIEVGVQSGSDRINKVVYRRPVRAARVLEAARLLNRYRNRLLPAYDIIFDNPYERFDDRLATASLVLQLPKPYALSTFSLVYFPGTEIYIKALSDGFIHDHDSQVFYKRSNDFNLKKVNYLKLVTLLLPSLPASLGRMALWRPLARFAELPIFSKPLRALTSVLFWLRRKRFLKRANVSLYFRSGTKKP